jgi:hypothetical protein
MFGREPALIISTVTAVIALGVAFGLDVTADQQEAIIKVVTAALGIVGGAAIRQVVTSDKTLEKAGLSRQGVVRSAEVNEARKKDE